MSGKFERRVARVLVVDDEPLLLEAIVAAVGQGADVSATVQAREALARIESGERFDVVLVDVWMPAMDGFALFDRIAAVCPSQARRVMFMAGGVLTSGHRSPVRGERLNVPIDVAVLHALSRLDRVARSSPLTLPPAREPHRDCGPVEPAPSAGPHRPLRA